MIRTTGILAVALVLLGASCARGATLQPIGNFDQPIYVTSDPGSPERIFVVERAGLIKLDQGGVVSTFSDLRPVVSCCESERGLLSIAPAPDFVTTGRLFVDYTGREEPGEIHVAELRASTATGATAPLSTLRNLLTIPHPGDANHYGGQLQFGPDGDLYISTGDGGGGNDAHHNAQNKNSLLGKILRIDPHPSGVLPYTVPAGNPFPAAAPPANAVWSYGLRNPFRFSFDRLSGAITIGDVGEGAREEIDYAPPGTGAGANYGWNCREGTIAGPNSDPECAGAKSSDFVEPVFDYPHGPGCAIIGGYMVRDPSLGDLFGRYLYGDLCSGELRSLDPANPGAGDRPEGLVVENLNSFGEDSCGRIYTVSGSGTVDRLVGAAPAICPKVKVLIAIRAQRSKVKHGGRAQIAVFVSPCKGRQGEQVKLLRAGRHIATGRLSLACTAHFLARVTHPTNFQATVAETATYLSATSPRLNIRIERRRKARRR